MDLFAELGLLACKYVDDAVHKGFLVVFEAIEHDSVGNVDRAAGTSTGKGYTSVHGSHSGAVGGAHYLCVGEAIL